MAMEPRGENRWRFRVTKDGILYSTNFFGTEKEAKKAHDAFRVDVERGLIQPGKSMKFGDYANLFYEQHMVPHLEPMSIQNMVHQLESRILPELGNMRLDKIKTIHLNQFYLKISKDLAPGSIKTIHGILSSMFSTAIHWELLERNPCANVRLPKQEAKKVDVYNYDELNQLFVALETCKPKGKLIILLALGCMMRRGEICALTEDDIDLERKMISVNKAAKRIYGEGTIIGPPKTPSSVRDIYTPQFVIDALIEHMDYLSTNPNVKNTERYLFPTSDGEPANPASISAFFNHFIKRTGLRKISLHVLRHTGATLLIYSSVNPQTIANTLGHSNINITSTVYLHQIENADQSAAIAMDDVVKKIRQE